MKRKEAKTTKKPGLRAKLLSVSYVRFLSQRPPAHRNVCSTYLWSNFL